LRDPDEALEHAIADACLAARAGDDIATDLAGFLARRGVAPADIEAILAAPRRLAVYRSLVRNGLSSVVLDMLPRTRTRLNAATGAPAGGGTPGGTPNQVRVAPNLVRVGRFDADLAAFVEERGPGTHYVRDFPFEFVAWAAPRWREDGSVPPYIPDLASYELAHFEVASAPPARASGALAEVALDRPVVFHESTRLARYAFAVHDLPEDGLEAPAARVVRLLAYRDAEHHVRWLELTPLAAALLERLLAGDTLGAAVERACGDAVVPPSSLRDEVARLLADLGSRSVLLGARAAG
jgi:hypothetical protein